MGFVYFIRPAGKLGPIKIGSTLNVQKRFKAIAAMSPLPITLIGAFESESHEAEERAIHTHLKTSRLHFEWFAASDEVIALIQRYRERFIESQDSERPRRSRSIDAAERAVRMMTGL